MHGRAVAVTLAVTIALFSHVARPAPVRASARGPAPHEWEAVRHALLVWANGVATSDSTTAGCRPTRP